VVLYPLVADEECEYQEDDDVKDRDRTDLRDPQYRCSFQGHVEMDSPSSSVAQLCLGVPRAPSVLGHKVASKREKSGLSVYLAAQSILLSSDGGFFRRIPL
jgi:hypothetical protein